MDRARYKNLLRENTQLKDVLVQKEQEIEKLRIANLFMGALFDGISEEIMVVDPNYRIVDVNRTFAERYGVKKADVVGLPCYQVKEGAGLPCHSEDKTCPLKEAEEQGKMIQMTHRHRLPSGDLKDLMLIMYPITAQDKRIAYFVEIVRDETEYRNAIRQLQASEQRFRTILDTATNAILSIDEDHNLILFNNAAQQIFKYARKEILGKNLNFLIPAQSGDHYEYVRRFLENRESDLIGKTINLTALRKTGEEFPIELSLSYMEMEGRVTFTAIIRDVSEEKQLERKLLQSERLAAVGQAVAHVAHELKNPLMIIGGFTGQIRKSISNDRDLNKLDMILEEVARLERLVAGLGDFTKTYKLVKRQADVNSVISDVMKIISELYPRDKYGFRIFLSDGLAEIFCDPDKLKQVFINVISNGFEAMADGGIMTVSSRRTREGIEVRITDEGVGIPESSLAHIFEPFYTTRKRGSGLGLPISYKIVEAHGGEIMAVSAPGRGTTFVIRLPER
ncbi:MAG: PAS domain S-box protein [Deltaproteobacteria bacterium]